MEYEQQELVRFKAGPAMGGEVGRSGLSLFSSFWKKISAPAIICLAGGRFSICPSPCTGAIQGGTSCPRSKAGGYRFLRVCCSSSPLAWDVIPKLQGVLLPLPLHHPSARTTKRKRNGGSGQEQGRGGDSSVCVLWGCLPAPRHASCVASSPPEQQLGVSRSEQA